MIDHVYFCLKVSSSKCNVHNFDPRFITLQRFPLDLYLLFLLCMYLNKLADILLQSIPIWNRVPSFYFAYCCSSLIVVFYIHCRVNILAICIVLILIILKTIESVPKPQRIFYKDFHTIFAKPSLASSVLASCAMIIVITC